MFRVKTMNKVWVIAILLYAILSVFAMVGMDEQIRGLQDTVTKLTGINRHLAEQLNSQTQRINACDRMIAEVGTSINRRFDRHKNWTYKQIQDLYKEDHDGEETA